MKQGAWYPALVFNPAIVTPFVVWSSLICLAFGLVHMAGAMQVWRRL